MPRLFLATSNPGKLREYRQLLDGCGWELVTPAELGIELPDEETGDAYEHNAKIKALNGAAASGLLALADDSGLEIDALPGELGPRAARFLGQEASYQERFRVILERLKGLPAAKRTARFRCVIAIAEPGTGRVRFAEGSVEGSIAPEPRGEGGFGYDPIFYLPKLGKTMAELSAAEKNAISHRARAAGKARALLEGLRRGTRPQPAGR
jgi:XTP/dITP diphosphohydrolase